MLRFETCILCLDDAVSHHIGVYVEVGLEGGREVLGPHVFHVADGSLTLGRAEKRKRGKADYGGRPVRRSKGKGD